VQRCYRWVVVFHHLDRLNKALRTCLAVCTQILKHGTYMGEYNTAKAVRYKEQWTLS
jgi:hypothetical protein